MALLPIITPIVIKLVITIVFILLNAILLREIVTIFKVRDTSMSTATAIAVWIGGLLFIFSFISEIKYIGWISALLLVFFIYFIKWYYDEPWKETILIWEMWMSVLIYLALFMIAFATQHISLLFWALIPLAANIAFILFMKFYKNQLVAHILSVIIGFLVINVASYFLLKGFFPI
jgi:hypothetical protein